MAEPRVEREIGYVADTRPLCQGLPFVLTDAAHPRIVLKHGSQFLTLDESALVPDCNTLGYGYYRYDTRHLSNWQFSIEDVPLSLLSQDVSRGYAGHFLYTNPQTDTLPQQKITISRSVVLEDDLWDKLVLENFHGKTLSFALKVRFQSDFADIFEVRGLNRDQRGTRMMPVVGSDGRTLYLAYQGLDETLLETVIEFDGILPDDIHDGEAVYHLQIPARHPLEIRSRIQTRWDGHPVGVHNPKIQMVSPLELADKQFKDWRDRTVLIRTNHEMFDMSLERAFRDLYILRQPTPRGIGLAAGIPWYCAVFGRDSAITAIQMLPFAPELARECIEVLAAYQGQQLDVFRAEYPGKIMHELRLGELARINAIPHSPYYGSIDATPLWILLFCRYLKWTGDLAFAHEMWPAVKCAMTWLDEFVGDGYLVYQRESSEGLENQGWKDSGDSIMHANGHLAEPPIAVCEAQAYLYDSKKEAAQIARILGYDTWADEQDISAEALKERFNRDFWVEELGFVAMALDGSLQPTKVISSNAGHCLWSPILDEDRANKVADRLMSADMQAGWGIRTLSPTCGLFNPISYHNGSVWPHDNGMIAEGLRRLERHDDLWTLMTAMLDVAGSSGDFRLPELFCGFDRNGSRPVDYPVSCCPQAWAAGSIFQFLSSCLNFHPDGMNQRLGIINPALPPWLEEVTIRDLRVGKATVDLALRNHGGATYCQVLKRTGKIRIVIET